VFSSFQAFQLNCMHFLSHPCVLHARPTSSSLTYNPNNICWSIGLQIEIKTTRENYRMRNFMPCTVHLVSRLDHRYWDERSIACNNIGCRIQYEYNFILTEVPSLKKLRRFHEKRSYFRIVISVKKQLSSDTKRYWLNICEQSCVAFFLCSVFYSRFQSIR
jgi:hypothetical protein